MGFDCCRPAVGEPCPQPTSQPNPRRQSSYVGRPSRSAPESSTGTAMPPEVQRDEYVPTLAICHATMQVRRVRLPVYRTAALPPELHRRETRCWQPTPSAAPEERAALFIVCPVTVPGPAGRRKRNRTVRIWTPEPANSAPFCRPPSALLTSHPTGQIGQDFWSMVSGRRPAGRGRGYVRLLRQQPGASQISGPV